MTTLREYLGQKREALLELRRRRAAGELPDRNTLSASVTAEGRSGVRRIRIREFQVVSDSGPDFAGYSLGPGSPELQLGIIGSCVTHIFLIVAADRQIPLDSLKVDVTGVKDARGGHPDHPEVPVEVFEIDYTVSIDSPASDLELADLHAEVERICPILNLVRNPQTVSGRLERVAAA